MRSGQFREVRRVLFDHIAPNAIVESLPNDIAAMPRACWRSVPNVIEEAL
jgi:hypothetical protein